MVVIDAAPGAPKGAYITSTTKGWHLHYTRLYIHRLPLKDLALYGLRALKVGDRPSSEWNMLSRQRLVTEWA